MENNELIRAVMDVVEILNDGLTEHGRSLTKWRMPVRAEWDKIFLRAAYDVLMYDLLVKTSEQKSLMQDDEYMDRVSTFVAHPFTFYVSPAPFSASVVYYVHRRYSRICEEYRQRFVTEQDDNLTLAMKYALDNTVWDVEETSKSRPESLFKDIGTPVTKAVGEPGDAK